MSLPPVTSQAAFSSQPQIDSELNRLLSGNLSTGEQDEGREACRALEGLSQQVKKFGAAVLTQEASYKIFSRIPSSPHPMSEYCSELLGAICALADCGLIQHVPQESQASFDRLLLVAWYEYKHGFDLSQNLKTADLVSRLLAASSRDLSLNQRNYLLLCGACCLPQTSLSATDREKISYFLDHCLEEWLYVMDPERGMLCEFQIPSSVTAEHRLSYLEAFAKLVKVPTPGEYQSIGKILDRIIHQTRQSSPETLEPIERSHWSYILQRAILLTLKLCPDNDKIRCLQQVKSQLISLFNIAVDTFKVENLAEFRSQLAPLLERG